MNDEQTRTPFETLLSPLMKDAYNLTRWLMKNQGDAENKGQQGLSDKEILLVQGCRVLRVLRISST